MSSDLETNLENLWKQNKELREQLRQDRIDQTARAILARRIIVVDGSVDPFYDSIYEQAEELERARERFIARRAESAK